MGDPPAWHRGRVCASHPAVPGSNLTAGKIETSLPPPKKGELLGWNAFPLKNFRAKGQDIKFSY